MKKIGFLVAAVLLLASCDSTPKQTADTSVDLIVTDVHNSRNSLDYMGSYSGTLPGGSSQVDVTIVLSDSTYTKDLVYTDKSNEKFSSQGRYEWSADGSTITLLDEDKPNQYRVEENRLKQLDVEGNLIVGELADMFVLKKR